MATHLHALKKTEKRKKLAMTDKRINTMNARLYDPALGRFLNTDPEVQLPDNTQSYNRYSYCLNNPLRYADPTGMFYQLPPQYKQRHLDPDTYDGEMLYELVVTGYRTAYWKGCGVFAPNAPYVDNYAFVLSNRYGQPQSPLPYGYGTTMGGGYTYGDINYSSRDKISIFINSVTVLPQTIINKWNAVVKKELPEGEKFSIASYGKLYGKDVAIVAKSIKTLSSSLLISDIAVTLGYITDDINEGKKASATMRGVVMGTTILIGFIPVVGTGISLGVGICDALYGQYLYDFIENRYGQILHSDSVQ